MRAANIHLTIRSGHDVACRELLGQDRFPDIRMRCRLRACISNVFPTAAIEGIERILCLLNANILQRIRARERCNPRVNLRSRQPAAAWRVSVFECSSSRVPFKKHPG